MPGAGCRTPVVVLTQSVPSSASSFAKEGVGCVRSATGGAATHAGKIKTKLWTGMVHTQPKVDPRWLVRMTGAPNINTSDLLTPSTAAAFGCLCR